MSLLDWSVGAAMVLLIVGEIRFLRWYARKYPAS